MLRVLILLFICSCAKSNPEGNRSDRAATNRVAAIAIRDAVPNYQAWATEQYTLRALSDGYAHFWYLSEPTDPSPEEWEGWVTQILDTVAHALDTHDAVDIFLLVHQSNLAEWVAPVLDDRLERVRLVYSTGGGSIYHADDWLALGADAFVGHAGTSMSPVFLVHFLAEWTAGTSLGRAVDLANSQTHEQLESELATPLLWAASRVQGFGSVQEWREGTHASLRGDASFSIFDL